MADIKRGCREYDDSPARYTLGDMLPLFFMSFMTGLVTAVILFD